MAIFDFSITCKMKMTIKDGHFNKYYPSTRINQFL